MQDWHTSEGPPKRAGETWRDPVVGDPHPDVSPALQRYLESEHFQHPSGPPPPGDRYERMHALLALRPPLREHGVLFVRLLSQGA
jgi:hypothetical protein